MRWWLLWFLVGSAAWLLSLASPKLLDLEQFEGSKHDRLLLGLRRGNSPSMSSICSLSSLLHEVNGMRVNQTRGRWQDIWWASRACLMSLCQGWRKSSCCRSRTITHRLFNLLARVLDHRLRWVVFRQPWNTSTILFSAETALAIFVVSTGQVAGCRGLILTIATRSDRGDHWLFAKSAQRTWTNVMLSSKQSVLLSSCFVFGRLATDLTKVNFDLPNWRTVSLLFCRFWGALGSSSTATVLSSCILIGWSRRRRWSQSEFRNWWSSLP